MRLPFSNHFAVITGPAGRDGEDGRQDSAALTESWSNAGAEIRELALAPPAASRPQLA